MSFHENSTVFNNQKVKVFNPEKGIENTNIAYSFAWSWDDEENIEIGFKKFLEDPKITEIKSIVIGQYGESDESPEEVVNAILKSKDKLQNLTGIFFGDITYEENECSWIENMDYGPLLQAFPNLEIFKVRGGNSLKFSFLNHQKLKTLIIETGGMSNTIFEKIAKADLPSLEHLELWLGSDNYGFEASPELVASVYKGKHTENNKTSKTHLEYQDEKSHKFWEIEVKENTYAVTYGKIGTDGQSKTKEFESDEKAVLESEKVTKQKLKKGYKEIDKGTHLPSLKYLGLRNSEIADQLAEQMKGDPILKRIEILDFSKGIIANNGAKAILDNQDMLLLKKLDLHHNFIADELAKELEEKFGKKINLDDRSALPLKVDTTDEDFDIYDYDMYIEVSE